MIFSTFSNSHASFTRLLEAADDVFSSDVQIGTEQPSGWPPSSGYIVIFTAGFTPRRYHAMNIAGHYQHYFHQINNERFRFTYFQAFFAFFTTEYRCRRRPSRRHFADIVICCLSADYVTVTASDGISQFRRRHQPHIDHDVADFRRLPPPYRHKENDRRHHAVTAVTVRY